MTQLPSTATNEEAANFLTKACKPTCTPETCDYHAIAKRLRDCTCDRLFPVMDGPNIPWKLLARHDQQVHYNHSQTLEGLARRGGMNMQEIVAAMTGRKLYMMPLAPVTSAFFEAFIKDETEKAKAEDALRLTVVK